MNKRRVIAVVNQKGGCGKTTTAVNLSASLARRGQRVALLDTDPQAHATLGLGIRPETLSKTLYDVLVSRNISLMEVLQDTVIPHLYVGPGSLILSGAQVELLSWADREYRIRDAVNALPESFEVVVIDCPPSLNILTINALVASTDILIPIQMHYYSLEGMKELFGTLDIIRQRFHAETEVLGILPTMMDARLTASKDMLQAIRDYFGAKVFQTVIHMSSKLFEAPATGKPIHLYEPKSRGAQEYEMLTEEVLQHFTQVNGTPETRPVHI